MTVPRAGDDAQAEDSLTRLLHDERGAEQMEYLLILALLIMPVTIAVRLFWAMLLFYFTVETLVVDLPFF